MGAETGIAWTGKNGKTFNGWIGCEHYGQGCVNCYAEAQNRFYKWNGGQWGKGAPRKVTSPSYWLAPLKWNREAEAAGERVKVFGFSLADWADADAPEGALPWLWALWRATPWLDWQMLTKRAERIKDCLPPDWGDGYANVWLGYSVACQEDAERGIPHLLCVPAVVHFLSCEPLVGPVDLTNIGSWRGEPLSSLEEIVGHVERRRISWVIVGGESGSSARPFDVEWARSLVKQCRETSTPVFVKQLGAHIVWNGCSSPGERWPAGTRTEDTGKGHWLVRLGGSHGGNQDQWPPDLRVREFPIPSSEKQITTQEQSK